MKAERILREERRHPRSPLGSKGTLRFGDGRELAVVFLDVSYGGTRVEIAHPVDPRFVVEAAVTVDVPTLVERSRGRLGPLNATVVWAKRQENGRTWLGLRFSQSSSASLRLLVPNLGRS